MLRPSHRNADAFRFDTRPLTVAGVLIAVNLAGVKTLSIHRPFSGWFQWQGQVIWPCVLSQQTPGGTYGNQTYLTPSLWDHHLDFISSLETAAEYKMGLH